MGFAGFGRLYTCHWVMGLLQLILGLGVLWSVIDGLLMLQANRHTGAQGRPLRREPG
jgi:hypothetical protein